MLIYKDAAPINFYLKGERSLREKCAGPCACVPLLKGLPDFNQSSQGDRPEQPGEPFNNDTGETMKLWNLWAKALGPKASNDDKESDAVALIRALIFASVFISNMVIVLGVIRHWND